MYVVENTTRIDSFLATKLNISAYRIKILLACSHVEILRAGNRKFFPATFLKDEKETVHRGDEIIIDDPLPDVCKCISSLDPSIDFYDSQYFELRGNAIEPSPDAYDLSSFIRAVHDPSKIIYPIRDLIIVSHGNPKGFLKLPLGSNSKSAKLEGGDRNDLFDKFFTTV